MPSTNALSIHFNNGVWNISERFELPRRTFNTFYLQMEPNFISNFRLVRDIVHHVVACTLFLFGKNIASLVMNFLKSDK